MTRAARLLEKSEILMHLAGTPGSGKTTLLNQLSADHPEFVYRDLDSFFRWGDPDDSSTKRLSRIRKWIDRQKQPIIIAGTHADLLGNLPPIQKKYYLNTSALTSALRANRRRRQWNKMDKVRPAPLLRRGKWIYQEYKQGRRDAKDLEKEGYIPKSYDQIRNEVAQFAKQHKSRE